jgi:ATP-dependent Lon protease
MKFFEKSQRSLLQLPIVPLRDLVVFPGMVIPVFGVKRLVVDAVEAAAQSDHKVFLACQKNPTLEPVKEDLYTVGCIGTVLQHMKLPDGTIRALVEGQERGTILSFLRQEPYFYGEIKQIPDKNEVDKVTLSSCAPFKRLLRLTPL